MDEGAKLVQLKPIPEQVVVVMGASSGMGRDTALRFAQRGAKVVVAARSEEALASLVDEIERGGGTALAITADVSDFAQVKAVADRAVAAYGRLDTWVQYAGTSVYGKFDEIEPEEFKRVIDVNLTGQAYGALAALPHLKREGRGALIHVSSGLGRRAVPLQSAYCASKHGMIGWLDALRVELEHDGIPISVTNVMPASMNTPFFSKAKTRMGVKPRPVPPTYEPHLASELVLYAAEHPARELTVGGVVNGLIYLNNIAPTVLDFFLAGPGWSSQQTEEPKGPDAPNDLFGPVDGEARIRGDYGDEALDHSVSNWFEMHPNVRRTLVGGVLGGLALVMTRRLRRI